MTPAEHATTVAKYVLGEELRTFEGMTHALDSLAWLRREAERANELQQSIKTIVKEDGVVVIRLRNRAEAAETRANELEREVEQLNARWRQHMDFCPRPPA